MRAPRPRALWLGPALALLACAWGGNGFTPLVSLYVREAGLSEAAASALFLVYVLGLIPGLLTGGSLSDRYGRRVVGIAVVVTGLASVLIALGALWLPMIFVGRFVAGVGLGCAMSTGATWVRELSQPPYEIAGDVQRAARRSSMLLTAGFGLGPLVAGSFAQWGPAPLVLPYLIHVLVAAVAIVALRGVPETVVRTPGVVVSGPVFRDARRFRSLVIPTAPWVFGAMAIAFIVVPTQLAPELGGSNVIFSTGLTLCALIAGFFTQPVARRFVASGTARLMVVAMGCVVLGLALAGVTVATRVIWIAPAAALVLGVAYGILMVSGLTEAQGTAHSHHTGTASAIFYSITYTGFFLPTIFSLAAPVVPGTILILVLGGIAILTGIRLVGIVRATPRPAPGG